ncbi:FAD-dependent oxidoreductase [Microbacterium sp.]|uniref:FAD-dependent oxidoreductase n=1 Tax=Microbacterium sp. TaxID=51671 RepID=UPI0039E26D24
MSIDVLVVGAGVSGLTVASTLARAGREVGVIEIADRAGGSAALSEGFVWTNPDADSFLAQDPGGDVAKFQAMRDEFDEAMAAIRALGIDVGPDLFRVLGYGEGNQIDIGRYLASAQRAVEGAGGWVLVRHEVVGLETADGAVVGAQLRDLDSGEILSVRTGTVVLATGGFQGSPELRTKYIGAWTRDILLRANAHSAGAGLRLGLDVGAAESAGLEAFYGHLIPTPLPAELWTPERYTPLSQYYSEHGVLLDTDGKRFVDESLGDHVLVQEVAKIGTALLFIDSAVWDQYARTAFIPGMDLQDKIIDAQQAGSHVSIADDLEQLTAPVGAWGFDRESVLATLRRVQDENGGPDGTPLRQPPYALLEVQPAITFTHGGLSTDVEGHVLRVDGTSIEGLRAVGVDAGGLNMRGYTGGLVRGITLGRVAARSIQSELDARAD